MVCPKCKELGLKSNVYPGLQTSTGMWNPPYYDEDGKYRSHNSNSYTSTNKCGNGHQFKVTLAKSCPSCDWGSPESVTILEDFKGVSYSLDCNGLVINGTTKGGVE